MSGVARLASRVETRIVLNQFSYTVNNWVENTGWVKKPERAPSTNYVFYGA